MAQTRNDSIEIAEALLEVIKSTLESGEDVLVFGFEKFCVKDKDEREGRNPASGERRRWTMTGSVTRDCRRFTEPQMFMLEENYFQNDPN